jgi:hypothetical protein
MVRIRVAAAKHPSFLETALNRHLRGPRKPRRSFRSVLIYAIESIESHGHVLGVKVKVPQRECRDAVSLGEHGEEHLPCTDVLSSHSRGTIAGDAEGMPGSFRQLQHRAKASHRAASASGLNAVGGRSPLHAVPEGSLFRQLGGVSDA